MDLKGNYLGQTKTKVNDMLGNAKGGVLFIDEAYELGDDLYGKEAMTVILAAMTDPQYDGTVIIVAGYKNEMDQMLNRNPGLKSRFTHTLDFLDWQTQDCVTHCQSLAKKEGFSALSDDCLEVISSTFSVLRERPGWANGRDVKHFWELVTRKRSSRVVHLKTLQNKEVICEDIHLAAADMISSRPESLPTLDPKSLPRFTPLPPLADFAGSSLPPPNVNVNLNQRENAKKEEKRKEENQTKPQTNNEKEEKEEKDEEKKGEEEDEDWFGMDLKDLKVINDCLEKHHLNTDSDVLEISQKGPKWKEVLDLLQQDGLDSSSASKILNDYTTSLIESFKQKDEMEKKISLDFELTKIMRKPIVQCQVCKRTADYWTPCPVAPRIIGYTEYEVPLLSG
jgi:hypothetical protein